MWHDSLYILKYRSFFRYLEGAIRILEDSGDASANLEDDDAEVNQENDDTGVNLEDVRTLVDILYAMMMTSTKLLLVAPETVLDGYENCPLVAMYLALARCLLYMKNHATIMKKSFSEQRQCEVDFCVRNKLCMVTGVRICEFSIEELIGSITLIERHANAITYTKDMNSYIDSLEERACELMLYAQPEAILNVKSMRNHYRDDLYTCSTSTEFRLVVGILSLRKIASTALVLLREEAIVYNDTADATATQIRNAVQLLQNVIGHKCKTLHGDSINEQYAEIYKKSTITISETCFFYKMNSINARIDCAAIVQTHRNLAHWYAVTEIVKQEAFYYIDNPEENSTAFQIVFKLMIDVLFQQTVKVQFEPFWVEAATIYNMSSDEFEEFKREARKTPFFVRSLCDACIFFDGQLYIFGRDSISYYRALAHWIILINTHCNGMISSTQTIDNLVDHLCSDDFNKDALAEELRKKAASSSTVDKKNYTMFSQVERERRRAFDLFNRVRLDIFGTQQALDSTNSFGDIESTGLPSSHRSAWFTSATSSSSSSSSK